MGKQSENKKKRTDDATAGLTSAERSAGIATSCEQNTTSY
jgi:hypothetical protein